MPAARWILVADASRARVFASEPGESGISEIADFANPQARSADGEIDSYVPGRFMGQGGRPGPRSATQQDSASQHSAETFSRELARFLDKARKDQRYDRLYLIAPPEFLGRLRQDLPSEVQDLVADEINKDVSWFSQRDMERYIRKTGDPKAWGPLGRPAPAPRHPRHGGSRGRPD